ncbi:MAG TPA: hypothetical protein VFY79_11940 [Dehalococcoidia bacterium]|nr:hypothetical protein [Dehalococcoidia bacterium]
MILLETPPAIVPVILVALMALGTALGYYIMRLAIELRPPKTAHGDNGQPASQSAVDALDELHADDDPVSAYEAIERVLRRYLDERFRIDSGQMLGADIERAITRAGYPRPTGRLTAHLIERCARAQSAATPVDATRLADDLRVAREVIALTAPSR